MRPPSPPSRNRPCSMLLIDLNLSLIPLLQQLFISRCKTLNDALHTEPEVILHDICPWNYFIVKKSIETLIDS